MTECSDWRMPYIAGLVDNHAGIVVSVAKRSDSRIGFGIQVQCRIKLSAKESMQLLSNFCEDHNVAYRADTERETTYDSYQVVISRRNSVQTFLGIVAPYLVARSDAVNLLCERIIPRLEAGDHRRKQSFLSLMEDIESFREKVGRANRAKYDREFFQNEWDEVL